MSVGGTGASMTGGSSGAGMAGSAGIGGHGNPGGGMGGECCAASGGAGGMMGAGAGGMMSSGSGGAGGLGGAGGSAAGTGGAHTDPDAGAGDPGAPVMECEESREVIELSEVIGAFPLTCMMEAPAGTLTADGTFSLAVTPAQDGVEDETMWSEHKQGADECGEDEAFYVDNSLGVPRLVLCPALCDSLTALSEDAAQNEGKSVTVEIIYGCEPPE